MGKIFLILLGLSSSLWAYTETTTDPPPQEFWRLIFYHEKTVGFTFFRITPFQISGTQAQIIHFETRLDVRYHKSRLKELLKVMDATLDLDHGGFLNFKIKRNPDFSEKVEGRMENGILHLTVYRGKRTYTKEIAVSGPVYLLDYLNIPMKECFVGNQFQCSVFNDVTLSLNTLKIHCLEKVSLEHEGRMISAIKTDFSMGAYHCVNYFDEQGLLVHFESEISPVQMKPSTENEVRHTPFESYRILPYIPRTGGEAHADTPRQHLTIQIQPLYASVSLSIPENERQQVTKGQGPLPVIRVTLRPESAFPAELPPETLETVAAPTLFEKPIVERLRSIAEEIRKKGKNDFEQALLLNRWIHQHIVYKEMTEWLSPEEILNGKQGDCKAHALLFSSIAKFLNLPTQFCVGFVHADNKFWGHVWLKSFVNGKWITFDPTFGKVCVDTTHLCLLEGTDDRELFFDFNRVMECLRSCEIEIVDPEKS